LRVANTPDAHFLLQAELKAIKQGLQYKEVKGKDGSKYKGYVNKDGHREGVGINITDIGLIQRGEWHANKLHGCANIQYFYGGSYWGEYKDHKMEGYGIKVYTDGDRYIGQWL
jgi:hypothetical protein